MDELHDPTTDLPRVSVKAARRRFGTLLDRAEAGERIIVTHRGKDIAVVMSSSDPFRLIASGQECGMTSRSTEYAETERRPT